MRNQITFWGNVGYPTNADARKARDLLATQFRQQKHKVKCSCIPGQSRKYAGLGQPDGRTGNVYIVNVIPDPV